ncbi:MAG: ATP-dependent RecD-like DNA helicase [Lachnospiraceae bacterium]|nr:ATP-dependent RecD-like DNA helicase [Lachnospiraceae bacterium]
MEILEGYVSRVSYRNEENGYTVLTLTKEDGETVLTGIFPSVGEGEYIRAEGEMVVHPLYGEQMKVSRYEFIAPSDEAAMERYLGSGAVKGIGKALAKRIVEKFGKDTFRIIEEEPERLSEVKGISERAAIDIAAQTFEKREVRNAVLFLQQYGISLGMAVRIYKQYGESLYTVIRENPYRLADDILGIGFKTADEIAGKMNVPKDSEYRVRSAVMYVLSQAGSNGHTYLPKDVLLSETEALLETQISDFDHLLQDLSIDRRVTVRKYGYEYRVYPRAFYRMEAECARMLHDLNISDGTVKDEEIEANLKRIEKDSDTELDDLQKKAVFESVKNGITIVTGGPGTGKTTTINTMIRYFINEGLDILLAAPTGRAAKRMTEATGYTAQTIHRMLELSGDPESFGRAKFGRNEGTPLEADVVIVDEMSMVDITIMHALLKAMVPGMRLVMVGDVDQLPSVGPGEVLHDLIASGYFPVVKLSHIFRQSEESDIVTNAHLINEGEPVEPKRSKDFLFILRDNASSITGAMITLLKEKLPNYVHADTRELQVLTPMRKGVLGVENLNRVLQEVLNPPSFNKAEKQFSFGLFREGDKVMQIRNDYQLEWTSGTGFSAEHGTGVFNGDTGLIRFISHFDETVTVEFEDRRQVIYSFSNCDELELAYAVTIHKSQGSEYPAVILPLLSGPSMLMTRNLLYTGVTRAKNCVCIVGKYETFARMIENSRKLQRYTGLQDLIKEAYSDH